MQYKKDNQRETIIVAAAWTFWVVTFYLGYLLAEATF